MGCGYCIWALQPSKSFSFSITKRKCENQTSDETHRWSDTVNDYWEPALQLCCLGHVYNPIFLESLDKENIIGKKTKTKKNPNNPKTSIAMAPSFLIFSWEEEDFPKQERPYLALPTTTVWAQGCMISEKDP